MWSKVGMGGEHHRYYKHNKFRQNPRGDSKFLVDLTRNDPDATDLLEHAPFTADAILFQYISLCFIRLQG